MARRIPATRSAYRSGYLAIVGDKSKDIANGDIISFKILKDVCCPTDGICRIVDSHRRFSLSMSAVSPAAHRAKEDLGRMLGNLVGE